MILYCPATHKPNKYQQPPPVGGRGPAASPSRVASAQALPVPGGDRTCAQALPAGERAAVVGVGASGVEDRGVGDSAYAGGRPAGAGRRESRPPLLWSQDLAAGEGLGSGRLGLGLWVWGEAAGGARRQSKGWPGG